MYVSDTPRSQRSGQVTLAGKLNFRISGDCLIEGGLEVDGLGLKVLGVCDQDTIQKLLEAVADRYGAHNPEEQYEGITIYGARYSDGLTVRLHKVTIGTREIVFDHKSPVSS